MNGMEVYLPIDRRRAIAAGTDLPDRAIGSVLFADISGFTPLTSALVKELGLKRGPEELTRQLNRVYNALVAQVHQFGGSVIGFSGDAITCWLNNDNGWRAVGCAFSMQRVMTQFLSITTPAGTPVSMGLKVAVASGPVRRFLVGDPHIQTIDALAGSTLDRVAEAEHYAQKGEVIVSFEVVKNLGDPLQIAAFRPKDGTNAQFAVVTNLQKITPSAPWPDLEATLPDEQIRPWLLSPVYERLKSGQEHYLAEIRPAVALFLRFGGIDYDNDDGAGEKLDAYLRWTQSVLAGQNGFLLQLTIGDKGCYLYAAFGAPITAGNNSSRAIAAALELQAPPPSLAFIGPVQIGISRGRMRAGAYGGATRRTYGVLGDEVNMAARLMSKAQRGQIIVSGPVANAAGDQFLLQSLGLIAVKGKRAPISAALVLRRRRQSARKPVSTFSAPLVGRATELNQLLHLLEQAGHGRGQIFRLQGAAGIGKSHLVAEFAEQALNQRWRVVLGVCQSTGRDISCHPWRQIFHALFLLLDDTADSNEITHQIEQVIATVSGINPNWLVRLPLLGDLLNLPIPDNPTTSAFNPQLRQEALFSLVIDLLQQWAVVQPLLILLDDVHWLDESSQSLVLALARVISTLPVMMVVIHRPPLDEHQPILVKLNSLNNYHPLNLSNLSPEGVAAAVTHRLQGPPSPLLREIIQLQARGNPFIVEEFVEALDRMGHLSAGLNGVWTLSEPVMTALRKAHCLMKDHAGRWVLNPNVPLSTADLGLPDSIHGLVLSRIDRLFEDSKLTLKVAAVIGRLFQAHLLAQSHPLNPHVDALQRQLESIDRRDFIRLENPPPQLTYIFKHNIVRDVAYDSLLGRQQQELHHAVAQAMEKIIPDAVEQLAYHYSRANVKDKSLVYLDKTAHKAQREYANETALNYYNQALTLEKGWERLKGKIEVLHILGQRKEEYASLKMLAAIPAAPPFEVAFLWGQYHEVMGNYPQAQSAVERALDAARTRRNRLGEIRCLAQLGLIFRRVGNFQTARSWYKKAYARFPEQVDYSDEEANIFAQILNGLGVVLRQLGEFEQAKIYYDQALVISQIRGDRLGEANALDSLGTIAYHQRNFAEAGQYHQQVVKNCRVIGNRAGEGTSLYNLALTTYESGDYGQAEEFFSQALTIQQGTGNRWEEINIWNGMGNMYLELGKFVTAQDCFQNGLKLAEIINDESGKAYLLVNLGLAAYENGNLVKAEALLTQGLDIAQNQDDKYLLSSYLNYLSMVNLAAEKLQLAAKQARSSLALRREINIKTLTADNLSVLAAIALKSAAMSDALHFTEQSLTLLNETKGEGPEFSQRNYFICYQVLASAGQAERAFDVLRTACNLVMARAEKIVDLTLRYSFLENVAINRKIIVEIKRT